MPVRCRLRIEKLSTDEFGRLDYAVMKHMFAAQNTIGRLADERVYQTDVAERLGVVQMASDIEVPIELSHQTFVKVLSLDLVVCQKAVYELKTVSKLSADHVVQMLTYLYLLDLPRGKLVNFRSTAVESQFVNAPISREERCGFSVSSDDYFGNRDLLVMVVNLVRDWGTSLTTSLYRQAMVHFLGGEEVVQRMLPLTRNGKSLANLISDN